MAQGALTAANVVQARTGSVAANTSCEVWLPAGTQAGSTVTVELIGPSSWPTQPDGWEMDATSTTGGRTWVLRKRAVAAGEGVQGSTSWIWTYVAGVDWFYRVTEWDTALEPVSPLEAFAFNETSGSAVTTLSTGTSATTSRPNVVALAMHWWQMALGNSAQTFDWTGHTNGFTERDEGRFTSPNNEAAVSWSWAFATTTGAFECTATANTTPKQAGDAYRALLVVYAATTFA